MDLVRTNPSILVTGGAGLIGAALCRTLQVRGARVLALDNLSAGDADRLPAEVELLVADAGDRETLKGLLEQPFDAVVHLAGRVGVRRVLQDPEGCREDTRALTRVLVDCLRRIPQERRPRLLAASTSEVYAPASAPLHEGAPLRSSAGQGRWAYSAARLELEASLAELATDDPEFGPVALRFFNVTGPGQSAESGMVLPRFVEAAQRGEVLEVHGDGQQVRTFAHVEDVAEDLATLVLQRLPHVGPLNLGGGTRTTILDLAQAVVRCAGETGARIALVDPRQELPGFEDIRTRIPDLQTARHLGLLCQERSLEELVQDMLVRHQAKDATCGSPVS